MGISKSTYYFEISKPNIVFEKNKDLLVVIQQIFAQNKGRYGARRVHKELVNRGYVINHKRVQRIMHEAGLFGKRPKEKYHSYKGKDSEKNKMDATCKIQDSIHLLRIIKKCVQDSGYI